MPVSPLDEDFLEVLGNSESWLRREVTQGAWNPLWNKVLCELTD